MSDLNPLYLLIAVPAILAAVAQVAVRRAYKKYGDQPNNHGITGLAAAKYLLVSEGLADITIKPEPGVLTDHYDPTSKTLKLSEGSANSSSVAALGVVAHEVGHAVQHAQGYRAMRIRTAMGMRLAKAGRWVPYVFLGGVLLGGTPLTGLGVVMMAGLALFSLVTLPVERNASTRALGLLEARGLISGEERSGVWQVLRAAALTYAASFGRRAAMLLFYAVLVATAQGAWRA